MSVLRLAPLQHVGQALELPDVSDGFTTPALSSTLPACPCCGASAFEGTWRNEFDLEHDCRCFLERPDQYELGLSRLWRARTHRAAYLESLPLRYSRYTLETLRVPSSEGLHPCKGCVRRCSRAMPIQRFLTR
jgi:hypothetical protein